MPILIILTFIRYFKSNKRQSRFHRDYSDYSVFENDTVEGDYKVSSGIGRTTVKLDNGTILYFEKGDLVGYIDEDLVKDIKKADDLDDLKDAFEDADADSSLIDVIDMCEDYGISSDDFVDWLDECGLLDDGLVYEAQ